MEDFVDFKVLMAKYFMSFEFGNRAFNLFFWRGDDERVFSVKDAKVAKKLLSQIIQSSF